MIMICKSVIPLIPEVVLSNCGPFQGIFMAGYFMISAFFILMVLWYVPDLLVKGSSIYYLWFDPDRLWSIPEDYKQKYYGPYPHVRDL
jgi:hypothetical protein